MSFQDDVRNTRESVLKEPMYKVPIDTLNTRVQSYEVTKQQVQVKQVPAKQDQGKDGLDR